MSEQLPADDVASVIAEYADKYESVIRRLVDSNADFNLTIEDVEVDAYWSYWLDGAGHDARLRINKNNASFTRVDAYRFALHEVLGHALQYSSLTAQAEDNIVEWPRILAVHCPHRVLFEGLAQVLRLVEAGGASLAEVLREAYRRPLTPSELHELWPTGPVIGGNQ